MINQERLHWEACAARYFAGTTGAVATLRERQYQAFKARLMLELVVVVNPNGDGESTFGELCSRD